MHILFSVFFYVKSCCKLLRMYKAIPGKNRKQPFCMSKHFALWILWIIWIIKTLCLFYKPFIVCDVMEKCGIFLHPNHFSCIWLAKLSDFQEWHSQLSLKIYHILSQHLGSRIYNFTYKAQGRWHHVYFFWLPLLFIGSGWLLEWTFNS